MAEPTAGTDGWRFVSEPIEPLAGTFSAGPMSGGAPGLPRRFRWGGVCHEVARVLGTGRRTGPCRHGSGERYVRRHTFHVLTTGGLEMRLYFERQRRRGGGAHRWWLAGVRAASEGGASPARGPAKP